MLRSWLNLLVPPEVGAWSLRREFIAGVVNFLTAGYIIVVNPSILSETGMSKTALVSVTCYSSAIGCFLMALWPRVPIIMAPGMGINAFFTYTLCLKEGVPWQTALGIVFISGVLFIIITAGGLRERILYAIPTNLRLSIPVGIGLFIALIGFRNMGLVVEHPITLVTLGPLTPTLILALLGLIAVIVMEQLRIPGSILAIILLITFIALGLGWVKTPKDWVGLPPPIYPVAFKLDILSALKPLYWVPIFAFLYIALFDSLGTLTAISYQAGLNVGDKIPKLGKMLMADAIGATTGAILGTSTVTAYIESGAGVAAGGRTGWTAFFTGIFFLLASFFSGTISIIPPYATAVALVVVGIYMIKHIKEIDFTNWEEGAPAFFTILLMPFTYSIATGLCFGILSYVAILITTGKWQKITPILAFIGILSLVYLIISPTG
ncbi:Guanine/hypoxanthine permease PbuG [bacterium HR37]|nr:Guanine/hypoxanthine permease PbuG [bacterium HR37]